MDGNFSISDYYALMALIMLSVVLSLGGQWLWKRFHNSENQNGMPENRYSKLQYKISGSSELGEGYLRSRVGRSLTLVVSEVKIHKGAVLELYIDQDRQQKTTAKVVRTTKLDGRGGTWLIKVQVDGSIHGFAQLGKISR